LVESRATPRKPASGALFARFAGKTPPDSLQSSVGRHISPSNSSFCGPARERPKAQSAQKSPFSEPMEGAFKG